jgi:hypothetical protein
LAGVSLGRRAECDYARSPIHDAQDNTKAAVAAINPRLT